MTLEHALRLSTSLGLMALMLSTGLSVDWNELKRVMTRWRMMPGMVGVNFLGVPLLTLGLIWVVSPDPAIAMGFLTLALAPGAPVGPAITGVARGDGPSAVGSMVGLGLLSVVLTPLLLRWLALFVLPESPIVIPVREIALSLLVIQIVPLLVGLVLRHNFLAAAERMARPLRMFGVLLLLVVVAALAGPACRTLEMVRLRGWVAISVLLAGCLAMGWWSGGRTREERIAGAVTASVRNVAAALVVSNAVAAETLAPPTVLAYGLLSTLAVLIGAALCARVVYSATPLDPRQGLR